MRVEVDSRGNASLSVVMPVHNAMPYLRESVASIRRQTFADFEFAVLDDASTDGSSDFLLEQAERDTRIRVARVDRSLTAVGAANRAVALSSGSLVARMDADDVCAPERLERQLTVFAEDPDVVLVGTLADGMDPAGRRVRGRDRWRLLRRSMFPPFPHGSIMIRRDAFDAVGGYREQCRIWHDVDMPLRLSEIGRIVVLPEPLYRYRYHSDSVTHTRFRERLGPETDVMWRCLRARREGRSYEDVLRTGGLGEPPPPVDPAAWAERYTNALRLWSGEAPLDGPPSRRLDDRIRTAWQRRHPSSLRALLRLLVAARDRASGLAIRDGRVHEWRYG
ncbi:MAG TPA: glycosyltransferase family A protein [Thermoleophilaceae bacterium]|jgi:glycosyltransferase involved in cell wall biosynthesis